jgi:hypothetical protein
VCLPAYTTGRRAILHEILDAARERQITDLAGEKGSAWHGMAWPIGGSGTLQLLLLLGIISLAINVGLRVSGDW